MVTTFLSFVCFDLARGKLSWITFGSMNLRGSFVAGVFHRGHFRYLSHRESPGTTFVAPGLLSLRAAVFGRFLSDLPSDTESPAEP